MKFIPQIFSVLFTVNLLSAQTVNFRIDLNQPISKGNPVSIDISSLGINPNDTAFLLYRVNKKEQILIPSQINVDGRVSLNFVTDVDLSPVQKTEFILKVSDGNKSPADLRLQKNSTGIDLVFGGRPILHYQTAMTYPPKGVNPIYKKSGFIHPLWSPSGEALTRIQPPDHYHHYGIWGPWTHTHINGRFVDFWNLGDGLATVRFARMMKEEEGPVYAGFTALQEHIDFGGKGEDQVALNELLKLQAWKTDPEGKVWVVDYTSTINSPLDSGIIFDAYRYGGGLGMRMTEKWHKDNCTVLTSEGHDRVAADGTNARWCIVEGESKVGRSGVLFMSHPTNRAHPEPMRVWPIDANGGRGDMFFEFCPIRHENWTIQKGKNYTLKCRMVVFDGKLTAEIAEQYWKAFSASIRAEKIN